MGAEDFAWFLDRVPGVLARLGVRRPGTLVAPDLHRGDFDVDETAIACGTRLLLATTMKSLRDATRKDPGLSTTPGGKVT
jgi:amidohydrolase